MANYIETFCSVLVQYSRSNDYDEAIQEWRYEGNRFSTNDYGGIAHCICGHPITDVRLVRNTLNGGELSIGNCCIKKFGIRREHWNKSRANYLLYAYLRASEGDKSFIGELLEKLQRYPSLKMSEQAHSRLERITGHPYRWKYSWY